MKIKLGPTMVAVSVAGKEFRSDVEGGIVDVGDLDAASIELLVKHAGCTQAGPVDEEIAAADADWKATREETIKALIDLGVKPDLRLRLSYLEEMLRQARAAKAQAPAVVAPVAELAAPKA